MMTKEFYTPNCNKKIALGVFWRLWPLFCLFIILQLAFRIYALHSGGVLDFHSGWWCIVLAMLIGLLVDVLTFVLLTSPFWMVTIFFHRRSSLNLGVHVFFDFVYSFFFLFSSVCSYFFWQEYSSQFNFFAVDYLLYSQGVFNNVKESFPLFAVVGFVMLGAVFFTIIAYRFVYKKDAFTLPGGPFNSLSFMSLLALFSACFVYLTISHPLRIELENKTLNEVQKSGLLEIVLAFFTNELPYGEFYTNIHSSEALKYARLDSGIKPSAFSVFGMDHTIKPLQSEEHWNVIVLAVESLDADFLNSQKGTLGLTPHLDGLARNSLLFTNAYAVGERTIHGLAALTLSMPPLPGRSVILRKHNAGLFTAASVLNQKGYQSTFFYGGYGYFDHMNSFFMANGFDIMDQASFSKDQVHFSNAWGVCDEDLLDQVIVQADQKASRHQPFFDFILTTSNHRPFTYPKDRIVTPSGTSRFGAVHYTDYAIGRFLDMAKTRTWFSHTIFVITADHALPHSGSVKDVDPINYHIPVIMYAPSLIIPQKKNQLISQIDIMPTVFGLMHLHYQSRFYGRDILQADYLQNQRAFLSNYQKIGYLKPHSLVVLSPVKALSFYHYLPSKKGSNQDQSADLLPFSSQDTSKQALIPWAVGSYQTAAEMWETYNKDFVSASFNQEDNHGKKGDPNGDKL